MKVLGHVWAAAFAITVAGPVAWWAFDRTPPFEVLSMDPKPDPVSPDDSVDLQPTVRSSGRQGCTATFQRVVVDETKAILTYQPNPSSYADLPKGVHHMHTTTPFVWSPRAAPGIAEISVVFNVWCNPLHSLWPIVVRSPPARITVQK